jgi:hypothetical protein
MTGWGIYQWASKMPKTQQTEKVILAIHGGTGLIPPNSTPELEKQYRQG